MTTATYNTPQRFTCRMMTVLDTAVIVIPAAFLVLGMPMYAVWAVNIIVPVLALIGIYTGIDCFHRLRNKWREPQHQRMVMLSSGACFIFLPLLAVLYTVAGWQFIGLTAHIIWAYVHCVQLRFIIYGHRAIRDGEW
jgi:hypothetical protein